MRATQILVLFTRFFYVAPLDIYITGRVQIVDCRSERHGGNLTAESTTHTYSFEGVPVNETGDCVDQYNQGITTSEVIQIFPYSCCPDESLSVICDQNDGGRWTIIQRRQEVYPRENFKRGWADYVSGFGELDNEFWMGLEAMHEITTKAAYEIHISLEDWKGNTRYALYSVFQVGPADTNYKLTISGYTGDAGDAMTNHNGRAFTTTDNDNDSYKSGNCANRYGGGGGWWYNRCAYALPNGHPDKALEGGEGQGIIWQPWLGNSYSLRSVTMKIRPVN